MGVTVSWDSPAGAGQANEVGAARDDALAGCDAADDLDEGAVLDADLDRATLEAFALGLDVDDGLAGFGEHGGRRDGE